MPDFEALLHQILDAAAPDQCRAFTLAFTSEEERAAVAPLVRKVAKRVRGLYAYAEKAIFSARPAASGAFKEFAHDDLVAARQGIPGHYRRACVMALATFAVGTLAEIKAFPRDVWTGPLDEAKAILLQRRPVWLPEFILVLLDHRWTSGPEDVDNAACWRLADDLVAAGLVAEPEDDRYPLHMVATRRALFFDNPVGALEFLRARPHLLHRKRCLKHHYLSG